MSPCQTERTGLGAEENGTKQKTKFHKRRTFHGCLMFSIHQVQDTKESVLLKAGGVCRHAFTDLLIRGTADGKGGAGSLASIGGSLLALTTHLSSE